MSIPFAFAGLDTGDIGNLFGTGATDPNTILAALPNGLAGVFNVNTPNGQQGYFNVDWLQISAKAACTVAFGVFGDNANRFFELARMYLPAGGVASYRFDAPVFIPYGPTVTPAIKMIADSGASTAVAGHISISNICKTDRDEFPLDGSGVTFGLLGLGLNLQGS